jgi:hypothetical protein
MADSIFRQIVHLVRDTYPTAAERISAPVIGHDAWLVGRLEFNNIKAPPYIAWVRGPATFRTPSRQGPKQAEGQSVDALAEANQTVTAFICGRDEAETELLWYATLGAVRDVFGANPQLSPQLLGQADWVTQNEGNAGYVQAGFELIEQQFNWVLTVPRAIQPLIVITATEHDCEGIVP